MSDTAKRRKIEPTSTQLGRKTMQGEREAVKLRVGVAAPRVRTPIVILQPLSTTPGPCRPGALPTRSATFRTRWPTWLL